MNVAIVLRSDEPGEARVYAEEMKMELGFMFWKAAKLSGPTAAALWLEKHKPGACLFVTDDAYPLHGRYGMLVDEAMRQIPDATIGVIAFDDLYRDIERRNGRVRLLHRSKAFSGQLVARFLS